MSSSGKQAKCFICRQTMDPLEQVKVMNTRIFHRSCFKCTYDGCTSMSPSDHAVFYGVWYCNRHLEEAIKKGNFRNGWLEAASPSGSEEQKNGEKEK